ncbi:MAG: GNAT family N-acetyltransferase [Anaerocolumna aminovalerica]|uniref:GNAT family N-acetyltransferase n=1 Tax=Anaerocolumna aminovalerica TaxID=1527 RepID=UPI0029136324|nr:GNAT family N-acetyltransferase [Anaerocolumna aminovalerica]MDU6265672.1 GNAT family N-acetyltransferase [Anaerocolumna aminovalerica]
MEQLETGRLILREWNMNDAADLYEYAKSKKVGPMAGWKPHANIEETNKILQMFIEENETWAICLKATGKVIGSIGLHCSSREHERSLGYVLSEDFWGKGLVYEAAKCIMEYAFHILKLEIISVVHFPFNIQSKRVIEKLGFQYIETKEKATKIFDGTEYDDVCYAITKEEFYNLNL